MLHGAVDQRSVRGLAKSFQFGAGPGRYQIPVRQLRVQIKHISTTIIPIVVRGEYDTIICGVPIDLARSQPTSLSDGSAVFILSCHLTASGRYSFARLEMTNKPVDANLGAASLFSLLVEADVYVRSSSPPPTGRGVCLCVCVSTHLLCTPEPSLMCLLRLEQARGPRDKR
jgi:hypothetical protein